MDTQVSESVEYTMYDERNTQYKSFGKPAKIKYLIELLISIKQCFAQELEELDDLFRASDKHSCAKATALLHTLCKKSSEDIIRLRRK
jgi:hypothetical protein